MPRRNQDGVSLRHVLAYLTDSDVSDADIARALDMPITTHQNRKNADDYPSFTELATLAERYGLSSRMLQIAFGWREPDEILLLDNDEMHQYIQQGGGVSPLHQLRGTTMATARTRRNVHVVPRWKHEGADLSKPPA